MGGGDAVADGFVFGLGEAAEAADVEVDPAGGVVPEPAADQEDFAADDACVADEVAAGLDDEGGLPVAEMGGEAGGDAGGEVLDGGGFPPGSWWGSRRRCRSCLG